MLQLEEHTTFERAYKYWLVNSSDKSKWLKDIGQLWAVPERDRTGRFSASSAGRCLRGQVKQALGLLVDEDRTRLLPVFMAGNFIHAKYQLAGLQTGFFKSVEQVYYDDDFLLGGSVDAIDHLYRFVEIKSMAAGNFKRVKAYGPLKEHKAQMHAYMHLTGAVESLYIAENKDTQEIYEQVVPMDDALMRKLKRDWQLGKRHIEAGTLPPCSTGGTWCNDGVSEEDYVD